MGWNDERPRKDATSTAKQCLECVTDVAKPLECAKTTGIFVMSLPPCRDLDQKGLEAFRGLSTGYKAMVKQRGNHFVMQDVM